MTYHPHATDWQMLGELTGAVILIVLLTVAVTNAICSISDWYRAWWHQFDQPRTPEKIEAECFTEYGK